MLIKPTITSRAQQEVTDFFYMHFMGRNIMIINPSNKLITSLWLLPSNAQQIWLIAIPYRTVILRPTIVNKFQNPGLNLGGIVMIWEMAINHSIPCKILKPHLNLQRFSLLKIFFRTPSSYYYHIDSDLR